ncbi:MAG: hypothetical protein Q7J21_05640, partial [Rugosibacter sp.]|nr:hypothetical protein [Rugosibacter sp.]
MSPKYFLTRSGVFSSIVMCSDHFECDLWVTEKGFRTSDRLQIGKCRIFTKKAFGQRVRENLA